MRKTDSLLRKASWTGVEVGELLIASLINDTRHHGKPDFAPLFNVNEFRIVEASLTKKRDLTAYAVFAAIFRGIRAGTARENELTNRFDSGFYRLFMSAESCYTHEETLRASEKMPFVMTREQYDRARRESEKESKESYSGLLYSLLCQYAEHPENSPEAVRMALEATKEEPATNARVIKEYCKITSYGYRQLPDGTRSDAVSREEWREKIEAAFLRRYQSTVCGRPETYEEARNRVFYQRRLSAYKIFYDGIDALRPLFKDRTGEDLPESLEALALHALECYADERQQGAEGAGFEEMEKKIELMIQGAPPSGAVWHPYETPPENLTKYDIITDCRECYDFTANGGKKYLKEFKTDYPELFGALDAYIKELFPIFRDITETKYNEGAIGIKTLAEMGIAQYSERHKKETAINIGTFLAETAENTAEGHLMRRRIAESGIAIYECAEIPHRITRDAEYMDMIACFRHAINGSSIEEVAEQKNIAENISSYRTNLCINSLRYVFSFNALVKIMAEVYNMKDLEFLQIDTREYNRLVAVYNHLIYALNASAYGSEADKARKREYIHAFYKPIEESEYMPNKTAVEEIRASLSAYPYGVNAKKMLSDFDALIAKLSERGGSYERNA